MDRRNLITFIIAALFLCLCVLPAAAVIQEVTLKGTIATLSPQKNTVTIGNPAQYGCDYPPGGSPVCTYTPIDTSAVTGTVPNSAVFTVFKTGDPVVATSLGGTGGTWITLARLYGLRPNEEYVTDIVGDPGTIPTPLVGDYALDITMTPDCNACSGTTCTAVSADVNVLSSGMQVFEKTLTPRQSFFYNGRNDGSSVSVTFVSGEASSTSCVGRTGMTGPQPVSVFVVNVVPPIGFAQTDIRTATTTRPDEALTPLPVTTTGEVPEVTSPAPVPTTKSGSLPFAVIGALGVVLLVLAARKH